MEEVAAEEGAWDVFVFCGEGEGDLKRLGGDEARVGRVAVRVDVEEEDEEEEEEEVVVVRWVVLDAGEVGVEPRRTGEGEGRGMGDWEGWNMSWVLSKREFERVLAIDGNTTFSATGAVIFETATTFEK